MATKADFTDEEWKAMQEGIAGAGMYVAIIDRGFFDSFKEASALAHHLRDAQAHSDSVLIRDLATSHDKPFGVTASPEEIEQSTVDARAGRGDPGGQVARGSDRLPATGHR